MMRRAQLLFFASFLSLAAIRPALAVDWVRVGGNASVVEVYVNRTSILPDEKAMKAWAMWDYAAPQTSSDGSNRTFRSHKTMLIVRCDKRDLAVMRFALYEENLGKGEQFGEERTPRKDLKFLPVDQTTVSESIANMVCKYDKRKHKKDG